MLGKSRVTQEKETETTGGKVQEGEPALHPLECNYKTAVLYPNKPCGIRVKSG